MEGVSQTPWKSKEVVPSQMLEEAVLEGVSQMLEEVVPEDVILEEGS